MKSERILKFLKKQEIAEKNWEKETKQNMQRIFA